MLIKHMHHQLVTRFVLYVWCASAVCDQWLFWVSALCIFKQSLNAYSLQLTKPTTFSRITSSSQSFSFVDRARKPHIFLSLRARAGAEGICFWLTRSEKRNILYRNVVFIIAVVFALVLSETHSIAYSTHMCNNGCLLCIEQTLKIDLCTARKRASECVE